MTTPGPLLRLLTDCVEKVENSVQQNLRKSELEFRFNPLTQLPRRPEAEARLALRGLAPSPF